MACSPPLCNGTGSWCGCNCQCCPPAGCCTAVTQTWECGTTSEAWEGEPTNNGCTCINQVVNQPMWSELNLKENQPMWSELNLKENEIEIPFPNFNFGIVKSEDDEEENDEFVWMLQGCSIPCAPVYIYISTTGCCLQVSGHNITVVGSGTISATVGSGPGECGTFTAYVNGSPNSANLNDCDIVTINLVASNGSCCTCCLINTECAGLLFSPVIIRQINIQNGTKKIYLNKKNLLNRIRNLRRNK